MGYPKWDIQPVPLEDILEYHTSYISNHVPSYPISSSISQYLQIKWRDINANFSWGHDITVHKFFFRSPSRFPIKPPFQKPSVPPHGSDRSAVYPMYIIDLPVSYPILSDIPLVVS